MRTQRFDISFYVMIMVIVYDGSDDGDDAYSHTQFQACIVCVHGKCVRRRRRRWIEYNTP